MSTPPPGKRQRSVPVIGVSKEIEEAKQAAEAAKKKRENAARRSRSSSGGRSDRRGAKSKEKRKNKNKPGGPRSATPAANAHTDADSAPGVAAQNGGANAPHSAQKGMRTSTSEERERASASDKSSVRAPAKPVDEDAHAPAGMGSPEPANNDTRALVGRPAPPDEILTQTPRDLLPQLPANYLQFGPAGFLPPPTAADLALQLAGNIPLRSPAGVASQALAPQLPIDLAPHPAKTWPPLRSKESGANEDARSSNVAIQPKGVDPTEEGPRSVTQPSPSEPAAAELADAEPGNDSNGFRSGSALALAHRAGLRRVSLPAITTLMAYPSSDEDESPATPTPPARPVPRPIRKTRDSAKVKADGLVATQRDNGEPRDGKAHTGGEAPREKASATAPAITRKAARTADSTTAAGKRAAQDASDGDDADEDPDVFFDRAVPDDERNLLPNRLTGGDARIIASRSHLRSGSFNHCIPKMSGYYLERPRQNPDAEVKAQSHLHRMQAIHAGDLGPSEKPSAREQKRHDAGSVPDVIFAEAQKACKTTICIWPISAGCVPCFNGSTCTEVGRTVRPGELVASREFPDINPTPTRAAETWTSNSKVWHWKCTSNGQLWKFQTVPDLIVWTTNVREAARNTCRRAIETAIDPNSVKGYAMGKARMSDNTAHGRNKGYARQYAQARKDHAKLFAAPGTEMPPSPTRRTTAEYEKDRPTGMSKTAWKRHHRLRLRAAKEKNRAIVAANKKAPEFSVEDPNSNEAVFLAERAKKAKKAGESSRAEGRRNLTALAENKKRKSRDVDTDKTYKPSKSAKANAGGTRKSTR